MEIRFTESSLGLVLGCRASDGAAVVISVKDGGAAKRGGAKPGMVVNLVNGRRIGDFDAVMHQVTRAPRPVTIGFEEPRPPPPRRSPAPAPSAPPPAPSTSSPAATSRGAVAGRWAAIQKVHESESERRLRVVRDPIRADVSQHDLQSRVADRVAYFNDLFSRAVREAVADTQVLNERDPERARIERKRRRAAFAERLLADRAAKRAPRPTFENVAGSPNELVIHVSSPALVAPVRPSDHVLYALVDVSEIETGATARKWLRYVSPIKITKPGKYALLTKMVPGTDEVATRATDDALYQYAEVESEVATAVYELGESPPLMQYEECARELAYVPRREADAQQLACVKCKGLASAERKLYARGDYVICRACALKGAGVMIDPGARRMWFSQMISFVGNRAIPLPRSQPLLTQILRVMQAHPGMSVRFEGHVNSKCELDCDGSRLCAHASDQCTKIPGGSLGLSRARAEAVKAFVVACGIEEDRVYAMGFAGTRRLTGDVVDEATGHINRRVEVHTLLC